MSSKGNGSKSGRSPKRGGWSLITDDDLNKVDKAAVKRDKCVVLLQVKYGYTRQRAREEISKRGGGV